MGYIGAFLIGAGVGFLVAAVVGRSTLAQSIDGCGDLLLFILFLFIAAGATLAGGLLGVFVLSLWRGEALTGLLICVGIVATLFAYFYVLPAVAARNEPRPDELAQSQKQRELAPLRRAFFSDYNRFLRAASDGNLPLAHSLLDAGMPYIAPLPGARPRFPLDWSEAIVEKPEIQNGVSLFRYSALELAAWHGRTEMVALLLTRERNIPGREERRERARTYALKYGHEETARLLNPANAGKSLPDVQA